MGIIWRISMPLLSTLAALVIIVHSAEEDRDRDRDYRYDLRPRSLDTVTPNYDQPWRVMEVEPMMKQSTQADTWQDFPEEPRRRPVRKRKRRPIAASPEHLSQERHLPDDPKPYEPEQSTEADQPRRRRRKQESRRNRWTEDNLDTERPLRRRGQRRKRPSLENWPRLSEFNEYRSDEIPIEEPKQESDEKVRYNEPFNEYFVRSDFETLPKSDPSRPDLIDPFVQSPIEYENTQMKQDKSLSEFSAEEANNDKKVLTSQELLELNKKLSEKSPLIKEEQKGYEKIWKLENTLECALPIMPTEESIEIQKFLDPIDLNKMNEKTDKTVNFNYLLVTKPPKHIVYLKKLSSKLITSYTNAILEDAKELMDEMFDMKSAPIDPVTLRDILKRSNGASLSEILQQHNLSLADLLQGRQNAISVLKSKDKKSQETLNNGENKKQDEDDKSEEIEKKETSQTHPVIEKIIENEEKETTSEKMNIDLTTTEKQDREITEPKNEPKMLPKRRFQGGIRRKLRLRPMINNTFKGQLNRDLMALTARKYFNHRNATAKSKEWRNIMPSVMNTSLTNEEIVEEVTEALPITTSTPEETTIIQNTEYPSTVSIDPETETNNQEEANELTTEIMKTTEDTKISTVATTEPITTVSPTTTTVKTNIRILRPGVNRMGLRQQAFNNRLKKKRLRQKNSTTESPKDDLMTDLFGMPNLVSSSEFIAKTQTPKPTTTDRDDYFTSLDDFITTEKSRRKETVSRTSRISSSSTAKIPTVLSTTEDSAKFEIEEIFNDTRTSNKLSRILLERNMTLSELVQHRERGSSHVHLADIFHNASKEPNPPEPFLSKSLIEPISKETYPLRALLDANQHDPNAKATTMDPNVSQTQFVSIPVVMDFGNNVNENGENMGIMSLFNKFTESDIGEKGTLKKDSEGTPYVTTVIEVNTPNTDDAVRESRVLKDMEDGVTHELANWNEILTLMRRGRENETEITESFIEETSQPNKNIILEADHDGDGLIVLEDLQHLKDFDSNIASGSEERIEIKSFERSESSTIKPGILDSLPSETRSVTVATASIVGLAMVLFLLTYGAFKWHQQRSMMRKKQDFCDERIPTPVFESRKGHKNNSSTRSISPMLASSNIYTMSTLDSRNGKESPEYMWDTLRKPFQ